MANSLSGDLCFDVIQPEPGLLGKVSRFLRRSSKGAKFPQLSVRKPADRKAVAVRWCRHVIQLALAEQWPQDELLERALTLLQGTAVSRVEQFRRENIQLAGFDAFWKFLQLLILSYGGPSVAVRDSNGILYSSRPTTNKVRLIAEQEMFRRSNPQWLSWGFDIRGMEEQICWMMSIQEFEMDMNHLLQVLSSPPFV